MYCCFSLMILVMLWPKLSDVQIKRARMTAQRERGQHASFAVDEAHVEKPLITFSKAVVCKQDV